MPNPRLDPRLLEKLSKKTSKPTQRLREQISRKTSSLGISSEAVLARWAIEEGIGVGRFLRRLPPEVRGEVSGGQETSASSGTPTSPRSGAKRQVKQGPPITGAAIDALLHDQQLHGRCKDLLLAKEHFDRVFREATTVLDDRLKTKSGIKNMNPVNLVGKVLNQDPKKAIVEISADAGEQQGFHAICQGVMLVFRNKTHHSLSDKFTREDALKFCGFIDTILGTIEQAQIHVDRF